MIEDHPGDGYTDGLPEEYVVLVRDALQHLYDPARLQTHPLIAAIRGREGSGGRLLRQALLDAIGALHPEPGVDAASRAWRAFRILELRYVVGADVDSVIGEVSLSKRQYHREHGRALQAVASVLWERWQLADRWRTLATGPGQNDRGGAEAAHDLAQREAERLLAGEDAARIDPAEVFRGVGVLLRPLLLQHRIVLNLDIADGLPDISGDRVALRQALLAILTPVLDTASLCEVTISVAASAGRLEARIVGPAETAVACQAGVAEARPFVESLGGEMIATTPSDESRSWSLALTFPTVARRSLLVVDNSPDFIRLVERYLSGQGWSVLGAPDAERAHAAARQHRPEAILLDVVLPGRDGWDLLLDLRSDLVTSAIPVIICSVLHEAAMAVSLGTAYLQKPIDQQRLLSALREIA